MARPNVPGIAQPGIFQSGIVQPRMMVRIIARIAARIRVTAARR